MKNKTLLIATGNKGKFEEMQAKLSPLLFDIIGLKDLSESIEEPEEYGKTIEENALIKAKYYGDISGHLTIADDGGIFVDALDGWPGVKSARVAETDAGRVITLLEKMKGIEDRTASFQTVLALYNPTNKSSQLVYGEQNGEVLTSPIENAVSPWGYNTIFFLPEVGKAYGELSSKEKNEVSHRGKALRTMFYELEAMSSHKNIPIGVSLVIQDSKVLMQLRNDPGNTNFHKKWEFPGGGIDFGETMHEHVTRETKEECGLDVEVVHHVQHIQVESHQGSKRRYQIILLPYISKVIGGSLKPCDDEVIELRWFELDDVIHQDLVGNNKAFFSKLLPEIREFLKTNPL